MSRENDKKKREAEKEKLDQEKRTDEKETVQSGSADEAEAEQSPEVEVGSATEEKKDPEDEQLQVQYMRLAADFQNYKRRVEKEKSDIYAFANEKLVVELLNVIDNFDRALVHEVSETDKSFHEGMSMIFKQFKGVLEKIGVEEVTAKGEEFDPNFHHAVLTENSVEYESGKVTQVLQKGYMLNKKVIRPAMVKVAE